MTDSGCPTRSPRSAHHLSPCPTATALRCAPTSQTHTAAPSRASSAASARAPHDRHEWPSPPGPQEPPRRRPCSSIPGDHTPSNWINAWPYPATTASCSVQRWRSNRLHCIDRQPDAVTLAVAGEVDLGTADQLVATAAAVLAKAPRQLVLDFTGVPYMGFSGLFGLIKLHDLANEHAHGLRWITLGALSDWS